MATIDIHRSHSLDIEQSRSVVDKVARRMVEKFGVNTHWDADTLQFRHAGIQGHICVGAHELHVHAKLGLMLSPLKARIEDEIRGKLDQYLGARASE
ncbi:polyhydroxyalkanoic acid system family protein [Oleiagrimonas sp.]|jgi:putative polyhydroxyalkanoate system protein|uniref:polyhydroxyalkanoic acid system family protein n=1 Tax=Oleiagrimonas sp. TaxID=2010330 RepID=UPI00261FFCE8|nr:polyhydroxyalkanoic acid system family protein [Oleiagrimonas sp.]MDA3913104.1 polyhydroxyalkanoic acid system family protein [Oleiagrimonas sp.]